MLPEPKYLNLEAFYDKTLRGVEAVLGWLVAVRTGFGITALKLISYGLALLFLAGVVYYIVALRNLKRLRAMDVVNLRGEEAEEPEMRSVRWEEIKKHLQSDASSEWKIAILEADALLDDILTRTGYEGESLGERLKKIEPSDFEHLQDVWDAHKVRNRIAHDAEYDITKPAAEEVIKKYESALKELRYT